MTPEERNQERRKHPRVNATLGVHFHPMEPQKADELARAEGGFGHDPLNAYTPEHEPQRAMTANLSEGGLCLLCDEAMEPGMRLLVDVDIPRQNKTVRALGKVVRLNGPREHEGYHQIGLEFMVLRKDGRKTLRDIVSLRSLVQGDN